jgi:predicted AAA+ superfamily ATPase
MKRIIERELEEWKESPRRKPLILRGLRQVGKTWSVKAFGSRYFEETVVVDLEKNPAWRAVFEGNLNVHRILVDLEILTGKKIRPGNTLLFIDEIQASPRAIAALRYFYEEMPDLHVIAAGSLLEFALKDIPIPVGRVQFMRMYPLCFAEYLEAVGNAEAASIVLSPPGPLSRTVHDYLLEELRKYFFVGGMPESVKAYVDTGSLRESFAVHRELVETYRMDFAKYAPHADKLCLNSVFTTLSRNVGRQIKYAHLAEGYSNPTLKKAFELLCLAGVVHRIPSVNPAGLPLGVTASPGIFKVIMADIGLMQSLSGMSVELEYAQADLLQVYRGAMAEQFVGQEMLIAQQGGLYYWDRQGRNSMAEVDFLAVRKGVVHPVEVKSSASGSLKSLHLFLKSYADSGNGMVFSTRQYAELPDKRISFIPLYFAMSATMSGQNMMI